MQTPSSSKAISLISTLYMSCRCCPKYKAKAQGRWTFFILVGYVWCPRLNFTVLFVKLNMSLNRQRGDIPPGYSILSKDDAIEYQWRMYWNWEPQGDVWPFSYGIGLLGGLSSITGIYINNHYRKKLRLSNYGKLSSYLPIVVLPTIMSVLFHQQYVSNDILIQKTGCPLCLEFRAATIQSVFGLVYPTILAPLASFMFATRHATYNVPSIVTEPMKVIGLWQKFTKPVGRIFLTICAFQSLAAMTVTYYEVKSYCTVQKKLAYLEQHFDDNVVKGDT